jgi:UDP-sugar transporter A1/2/3
MRTNEYSENALSHTSLTGRGGFRKSTPFHLLGPKWLALSFFLFQNTVLVICLRYCAVYSDPNQQYLSSTVVLFTEALKLVLSLIVCLVWDARWSISTFRTILLHGFLEEGTDTLQLLIPAFLYTIQNNLQYVIETSQIFQVLYQLKLLTTALFYSTMLSRRVSFREWISILALAIGVSIVQSSQSEFHLHHADNMIGIESVIIACITSGFAGVYFEKIVKESKSSVWVINIQLSFLSCGLSLVSTYVLRLPRLACRLLMKDAPYVSIELRLP